MPLSELSSSLCLTTSGRQAACWIGCFFRNVAKCLPTPDNKRKYIGTVGVRQRDAVGE